METFTPNPALDEGFETLKQKLQETVSLARSNSLSSPCNPETVILAMRKAYENTLTEYADNSPNYASMQQVRRDLENDYMEAGLTGVEGSRVLANRDMQIISAFADAQLGVRPEQDMVRGC